MSLVNQMLKDLEQRRAELPGGDRLHGLRAAPDSTTPMPWIRWPLLLIAAGVAGSGFGWWLADSKMDAVAPMAEAAPATAVRPLPAANPRPANAGIAATPPATALAQPKPSIETATVAAMESRTAAHTDPKPASAPTTTKPAPKPVPKSAHIMAMSVATHAAPNGDSPVMNKTLRTQNPREQATQHYNVALQALARSEIMQAEIELHAALDADPGHAEARETLATLMLQQGRRDDAAQLLATALKLNPAQPRLAMLQARLLADAGHDADAVAVLQAGQTGGDADYQALLGALQQRLGNDTQAAAAYRQALADAPQRGTWWLGLGISLERSRQPTAALDAYRNALRDSALTTQVSDYVRARIAALSSGQG